MRPRISMKGCVGPSVHPLVRNAFVKIAENGVMQDGDASYVVYTALFFNDYIKIVEIKKRRQRRFTTNTSCIQAST